MFEGKRWYAGRGLTPKSSEWVDQAPIPGSDYSIGILAVDFDDRPGQHYALCVPKGQSELEDVADNLDCQSVLYSALASSPTLRGERGSFEFCGSNLLRDLTPQVRSLGVEQSNTAFVVDESVVVKLFRRVSEGTNPDVELLQALTSRGFKNIPAYAGHVRYVGDDGRAFDLALATKLIAGAVNGWVQVCESPESVDAGDLGRTIAQMHNALGQTSSSQTLATAKFSKVDVAKLTSSITTLSVEENVPVGVANQALAALPPDLGRAIRVHGDLHLGQTLYNDDGWFVLDFEGEPARPMEERRGKASPLKDVAGMIRSFSYAEAHSGNAGLSERLRVPFLDSYIAHVDAELIPGGKAFETLLTLYELDKALYELRYERRYRPDWAAIPEAAIDGIAQRIKARKARLP